MNEPHPREEAIFDGALQLAPEQREAYLQAACDGDIALRERIRDLIRFHERGDGPLEIPAVASAPKTPIVPSLPPGEKPGDKIGNYKILQLIGEGGCGSVFMAEQEQPVRRRVALKVIKLGMDTRNVIARFEAERQALALMDHPNIAKVFDAGATATGRPYFVMELVRGIKITEYCDQNNLPTNERLKLFQEVCQAIQHAHQKGIIHRDIKPSNILVTQHDGVPVPKVIDFGIAKATGHRLTDKTVFTEFDQFIGTPAYMSPEQAEISGQDIDTRSDIYSLGVLLYELLTSRTPFDPRELMQVGLDAMRRAIREVEPQRPSTRLSTMQDADLTTIARQRQAATQKLIHLIRGDLDWIVMKSLEKNRTRRYETASSFAGDIEHFLNNEPVVARPPTALYRFQKLVRRNQMFFMAGTAVALAIVAGLVVSTWLFFREQAARRDADREAQRSQQVAQFLEDMLKGVGPGVALGRDTTRLREILDKTLARVTDDLKDQPEVQAEICNTLGEVYRALGQSGKAEQLHRNARSLLDLTRGAKTRDVAVSLNDLALVLRDQGKFPEAEALHREALELRRKLHGNEHAKVAESMNNLALVLRSQGRLAEAERLHRDALAMELKLFGHEHLAVATSLNNLALALDAEGKPADAESCLRESIAIQKKLLGDNQPGLAITMDNLAFVLREVGKLPEAEALVRQSLAIQQKIFGPEYPSVATAINNLGLILAAQGKTAEAEQLLREALAQRRKLLGPAHPELAASLHHLAALMRDTKNLDEAGRLEGEALAMRKNLFGEENPAVADSLNNLALIRRDENNLAEAEALFQKAAAMQNKFLGDTHPNLATTLNHLALVLRDEGKLSESEASLRRVLEIRRKLFGDTHPSVTATRGDLTNVLALERKSGKSGGTQ
jgi:serine/threonine protein kinase/tetratricopeptide (TPR) repeat protein